MTCFTADTSSNRCRRIVKAGEEGEAVGVGVVVVLEAQLTRDRLTWFITRRQGLPTKSILLKRGGLAVVVAAPPCRELCRERKGRRRGPKHHGRHRRHRRRPRSHRRLLCRACFLLLPLVLRRLLPQTSLCHPLPRYRVGGFLQLLLQQLLLKVKCPLNLLGVRQLQTLALVFSRPPKRPGLLRCEPATADRLRARG